MPAHWTHIRLARTLLSDSDGWIAPGWAADPAAINALHHGALGPDMGYFPGADTLLGELAHYVHPGALVREMVRRADSDLEQAYAWGWASHLIADVDAHLRVVNPRCGEIVNGSRNRPIPYVDSPGTHIAVELGIDALALAPIPNHRQVRLAPALDEDSVTFVTGAYRSVYDVEIDSSRLMRSHRVLERFQPVIFRFSALMGRRQLGLPSSWPDRLRAALYLPVRWATALLPGGTRVRGAIHPDNPPDWVLERTEAVLMGFPQAFARHIASGFAELLDVNVDTGGVDNPSYPFSAKARKHLARRRG